MPNITKRDVQLDYILLDASGSMIGKWMDSLQAIDTYVRTLKEENVNSDIFLHLFTSGPGNLDLNGFDANISQWETALGLVCPGLGTPLYDAIALMARRMRDFDPPKARITIVTDGREAGSTYTTLDEAKAYLDWCRGKGWIVTFIGADFSNAEQAKALGADANSAIGVQQKLLSKAAENYGKKAANHAKYGGDMGFSKDEQQQFGGYLAAPSS